jgi:hypothetical protein
MSRFDSILLSLCCPTWNSQQRTTAFPGARIIDGTVVASARQDPMTMADYPPNLQVQIKASGGLDEKGFPVNNYGLKA